VPLANACEQVEPQAIPAGLDVTEPAPFPALATVSVVSVVGGGVPVWNVP
jgi:hypothetical protein